MKHLHNLQKLCIVKVKASRQPPSNSHIVATSSCRPPSPYTPHALFHSYLSCNK